MLSQGDHVDPDMGTFHYQLNAEILQLHKDGVVAHDRCLDILKLVWKLPDKHHQGRPTDLGNLPLILCQGFSATELGFGNIFDKFDGERCDDVGIWNPVSASMVCSPWPCCLINYPALLLTDFIVDSNGS
jgi:hypothetical protein